jgi:hypothetical protein
MYLMISGLRRGALLGLLCITALFSFSGCHDMLTALKGHGSPGGNTAPGNGAEEAAPENPSDSGTPESPAAPENPASPSQPNLAVYASSDDKPSGTALWTGGKFKDALAWVYSNKGSFTGKKAVVVISGTVTAATEGGLAWGKENNPAVAVIKEKGLPDLVLRGKSDTEKGIIDGEGKARVLLMENYSENPTGVGTRITLADNIILCNGNASGGTPNQIHGGGVFMRGVALTMTGNSLIESCSSKLGGGVYMEEDKVDMNNHFNMTGGFIQKCSVPLTESGGGVFVCSNGTMNMSGSAEISCNSAGRGGGVTINGKGTLIVDASAKIIKNMATADPGVYCMLEANYKEKTGAIVQ